MKQKKVERLSYFLLRWFKPKTEEGDVRYAADKSYKYATNRTWRDVDDIDEAYRFEMRSDARRTVRSSAFDPLREKGFYWEVVEVEEEIVRTYTTTVAVSNAPPLVTIARAAS